MRAMRTRAYGGVDRLALEEIPRPVPGPGMLLVQVQAASVNPVDWKLASGALRLLMPLTFPHTPGFDVAGEVVEVGPGVTGLGVGDRVHARIAHGRGGASAELALVGGDVATKVPAGMEAGEAAGLPLAGMTALQGLRDGLRVPLAGARERVLVVGASGGVGHLAVQLARAAGARVVGVCSARNAALVASLGAHEVLDYAQPDPYRGQAPFDAILDCVGGSPGRWLPLLTPRGRFASCVPGPAVVLRSLGNLIAARRVHAVMLKARAADLGILDRLVEEGRLRVVVDSRYPLAELGRAWERSMSGRTVGKIVVDVAAPRPADGGRT